jgi:hypothetical protein
MFEVALGFEEDVCTLGINGPYIPVYKGVHWSQTAQNKGGEFLAIRS